MKNFVLMILILFIGNASLAVCNEFCVEPYDLTCGVSRFFSKLTGQNFLAEKIANHLIKKEVQKEFDEAKIKADLKSFSVRDLKAGRFRTLEILGEDIASDGAYITSFKAKTSCNFHYLQPLEDGEVFVKENMPIDINIVISENDLNKTLESYEYQKLVNDINSYANGIFNINSTRIRLQNHKLYYVVNYSSAFSNKSRELVLGSDLCVKNGEIILANVKLEQKKLAFDINKLTKMLNYINPLDFSLKILENKDADLKVQNVVIKDKQIKIDGKITVLKDKEQNYARR